MKTFGNNLSEGHLLKNILKFSFPFLVSNIVQSLYNVADMLIVGNYQGTAAMSGVNIGGQITFILTNIVFGLCTGAMVLASQYVGAKNEEKITSTIATLLATLTIVAVFLTFTMFVFKRQVLMLIQTPAESFQDANEYLSVTLIGIIFIFGYNALSAILRGLGDSKRPFYFILIACITNIILDFVFVAGFQMGALGAAIATVISQALSMILCIANMVRNKFYFDFKPRSFRINKEQFRLIFKIGLPTSIQNGVTSLSFLFITTLVNSFGVAASAAIGAVGKFNSFAIMPAIAMGASVATISAQNIGAGKWDRAIKTTKIGTAIAFSITVSVFVLVQLFPENILRAFADDADMIAKGVTYLRTFSFDYLIVPFVFCANGLFTGAGHTFFSLMMSLLSSLALRIPVSYIFGISMNMGLSGVGLGAPAASLGALLLIVVFLISGKWRTNVVTKISIDQL